MNLVLWGSNAARAHPWLRHIDPLGYLLRNHPAKAERDTGI